MRTFYVAASSRDLPKARAAMKDLEALGLTNAYDWTTNVEPLAPVDEWPMLAENDLHAACGALVFVLLAEPESLDGMCELGARLTRGLIADVIGGEHLFFYHPQVKRHKDWAALMRCLTDAYGGGVQGAV